MGLGLIRVAQGPADIVISYNVLVSGAEDVRDLRSIINGTSQETNRVSQLIDQIKQQLETTITAFTIKEWSLFA